MPSQQRPGTGRPRPVKAVRRTAPPEESRSKTGLTTRAAILGLVVCALVVSAALPLRTYLSQRGQIADSQAQQAAAQAQVNDLKKQLKDLQDPTYVKEQARTRLHFVLPGETAYVVLNPSVTPDPNATGTVTTGTATGPEAPWYSQVWGSVQTADKPAAVPSHKP